MKYSADLFNPHVGSTFVFSPEVGKEFVLTLDKVECKPSLNAGPYHTFTLLFSSSREAFFPQGSYCLQHPVLGEQTIFLTATAETETSFRYQAPFSVRKEDPVPGAEKWQG
jgi:hypothetical protein